MIHLNAPCSDCPFLKVGGVRLRHERVLEIVEMEQTLPCHKTTVDNDEGERVSVRGKTVQCGGFLIFKEKQGYPNQMMRIAERLGMYDRFAQKEKDKVCDDLAQLLRTCVDADEHEDLDEVER